MKPKHRLSNMDFSKEGCHVALVTKKVGGAANGRVALLYKSLNSQEESMQEEMITKAAHEEFVAKAVQEALEPVQKALKDAEEQLNIFKSAQVEMIQKSRKEQLAAVMGSENPELDAEFEIIKGLDDVVFDLVIKSKKQAVEALEKSAAFKEVGVSGEADTSKVEESKEMAIIKQMISKSK